MANHLDTIFSPGLYLDRDKKAFAFIKDRLTHQEPCAVVTMYGNGKDYLFSNLVKELEKMDLPYTLKVLNTISEDELRDFATMLEAETDPTICMVNIRIGKDVSWFVDTLEDLRFKRKHDFVSFINAYLGDVFEALHTMGRPLVDSLVIKELVPYEDALHIIEELSNRFEFYPNEKQKQDIYKWSYGHVGLLRSLFLLKQQHPDTVFTETQLLHEPTVLERLTNIIADIPGEIMQQLLQQKLTVVDIALFEKFGYINKNGQLFHPLLEKLIPEHVKVANSAFSHTEMKVLDYFQSHPNEVVAREDIGRLVWGEEEWEDKYSDWAIGQLIYRLRKKLEYSTNGTIQTQKGQGFVYQPTTL